MENAYLFLIKDSITHPLHSDDPDAPAILASLIKQDFMVSPFVASAANSQQALAIHEQHEEMFGSLDIRTIRRMQHLKG
ncbi:hypothetical protein NF212_19470 [Parasalinivibrio latis]|uniref:hypothetical protein n=1 Tax=Parasalinivibrio latis TaxID=2952610 RepID=UPI0030DFEE57